MLQIVREIPKGTYKGRKTWQLLTNNLPYLKWYKTQFCMKAEYEVLCAVIVINCNFDLG